MHKHEMPYSDHDVTLQMSLIYTAPPFMLQLSMDRQIIDIAFAV